MVLAFWWWPHAFSAVVAPWYWRFGGGPTLLVRWWPQYWRFGGGPTLLVRWWPRSIGVLVVAPRF